MAPSVQCRSGGAIFNSGLNFLSGPSQGSFSESGSANGTVVSGSADVNGRTYRFTCPGNKLVRFTALADGWAPVALPPAAGSASTAAG